MALDLNDDAADLNDDAARYRAMYGKKGDEKDVEKDRKSLVAAWAVLGPIVENDPSLKIVNARPHDRIITVEGSRGNIKLMPSETPGLIDMTTTVRDGRSEKDLSAVSGGDALTGFIQGNKRIAQTSGIGILKR